jgi:hypothetical protein
VGLTIDELAGRAIHESAEGFNARDLVRWLVCEQFAVISSQGRLTPTPRALEAASGL